MHKNKNCKEQCIPPRYPAFFRNTESPPSLVPTQQPAWCGWNYFYFPRNHALMLVPFHFLHTNIYFLHTNIYFPIHLFPMPPYRHLFPFCQLQVAKDIHYEVHPSLEGWRAPCTYTTPFPAKFSCSGNRWGIRPAAQRNRNFSLNMVFPVLFPVRNSEFWLHNDFHSLID